MSNQADPTRILDDTRVSLKSDSASQQANGDSIQRLEGELANAGEHILTTGDVCDAMRGNGGHADFEVEG